MSKDKSQPTFGSTRISRPRSYREATPIACDGFFTLELWLGRSIIIGCWIHRGFATMQILYLNVCRSLRMRSWRTR